MNNYAYLILLLLAVACAPEKHLDAPIDNAIEISIVEEMIVTVELPLSLSSGDHARKTVTEKK